MKTRWRRLAAFTGLIGLFGVTVEYGVARVVGGWIEAGFPDWFPMVGTRGETVMVYSSWLNVLSPLLVLGLAIGVGYYFGGRLPLRSDYLRFIRTAGVGSTAGVAVGWALLMWVGASFSSFDVGTALIIAGHFIQMFVTVALVVTITTFAGAVLATFRNSHEATGFSPSDAPGTLSETANH